MAAKKNSRSGTSKKAPAKTKASRKKTATKKPSSKKGARKTAARKPVKKKSGSKSGKRSGSTRKTKKTTKPTEQATGAEAAPDAVSVDAVTGIAEVQATEAPETSEWTSLLEDLQALEHEAHQVAEDAFREAEQSEAFEAAQLLPVAIEVGDAGTAAVGSSPTARTPPAAPTHSTPARLQGESWLPLEGTSDSLGPLFGMDEPDPFLAPHETERHAEPEPRPVRTQLPVESWASATSAVLQGLEPFANDRRIMVCLAMSFLSGLMLGVLSALAI